MTGTLADPAALLAAWESAAAAPAPARGAVLALAVGLAPDLDTALDLPLGEVAAHAARMYAQAFGPAITGVVACPDCGELLEATVGVADVLTPTASDAALTTSHGPVAVRAPTTRDLLAVRHEPDPAGALATRCVRAVDGGPDTTVAAADAVAVEDAVEELSGAAATVLVLACPGCSATVRASLDLPALLFERVRAAAPRLLEEVATLAAAYGWSERGILALSPARRSAYLELARR
ncbi:MAG TPA: hypothetical protein VGQ92_13565 [Actinoplanes sp.]|nr:hypothetical protein [Actinoplanes sp.]